MAGLVSTSGTAHCGVDALPTVLSTLSPKRLLAHVNVGNEVASVAWVRSDPVSPPEWALPRSSLSVSTLLVINWTGNVLKERALLCGRFRA